MGESGTGKSSVARWLLKTFSTLREAQVPSVEVNAYDLLGEYVGDVARQVSQIFDRGRDGLIFIDDLHAMLNDDSYLAEVYGLRAFQQLVAEMQRSDNLGTVVVIAGCPDELMDTLRRVDPGLFERVELEYPQRLAANIAQVVLWQLGYTC